MEGCVREMGAEPEGRVKGERGGQQWRREQSRVRGEDEDGNLRGRLPLCPGFGPETPQPASSR